MTVTNPENDIRSQYIACFLIVLSLFAVASADHWNWRDLANAGQTVLGFGGGILTGRYLAQQTKNGDINNSTASTPESEQ